MADDGPYRYAARLSELGFATEDFVVPWSRRAVTLLRELSSRHASKIAAAVTTACSTVDTKARRYSAMNDTPESYHFLTAGL
jgi:hypothetical protein